MIYYPNYLSLAVILPYNKVIVTGYFILSNGRIFTPENESTCIHSGTLGYTQLRFYDINLVSFKIAYHELNEEILS